MRKSKRLVSMALSLGLLASVLAGCGSTAKQTAESSAAPSKTEAPAVKNAEKLELSVAVWGAQDGFNDPGAANDTIYNDLCKKLNITIKPIQITWNDWQDKVKIWAASSQLPDVFANLLDPALNQTFAKQGIIKAIPSDLSKYPNIKTVMDDPSLGNQKVDGKYYYIPRAGGTPDPWSNDLARPMIYRKDWAKAAGYDKAPQTFDEYVTMTKKVMEQHSDAVGLSVNNKGYLGTVFLWSFPEAAWGPWIEEDGKWIPSYASPKMYTGLQQLRSLYTSGILDKDFIIQKDADGVVKFQNGKSFSCFVGNNFDATKFITANKGATIKDSVGFILPFPAPDGKRYCPPASGHWSETYFRNTLDDAKYDRALQMIDYMLSDEYITLKTNGIEGVDWKMSDGNAVSLLKPDEVLAKKYPITDKISWLATWGSIPAYSPKKVFASNEKGEYDKLFNRDTYLEYKKQTIPLKVNNDVNFMHTPAKDKALNVTDEMAKVIIGKDDVIKMWKDSVNTLKAKGWDKAIEEVNANVKELGIK